MCVHQLLLGRLIIVSLSLYALSAGTCTVKADGRVGAPRFGSFVRGLLALLLTFLVMLAHHLAVVAAGIACAVGVAI